MSGAAIASGDITPAMIEDEIRTLHVEFERWFWGRSTSLERVENALADEFLFIGTNGRVVPRHDLMEGIRAAAGSYEGPESFAIEVAEVKVVWHRGRLVSASYLEIHRDASNTTTRQSSVVFEVDSTAPDGLRWMSVHETWLELPPDSPRTGADSSR